MRIPISSYTEVNGLRPAYIRYTEPYVTRHLKQQLPFSEVTELLESHFQKYLKT